MSSIQSPQLVRAAGGDRIVNLVDQFLHCAVAHRASDVHFEPRDDALVIRFRIDGLLVDIDRLPINLTENVVARLKVMAGLLTYRQDIPQEGSLRHENLEVTSAGVLEFRIATFPTVRGERVVVRILRPIGEVSGLDELGLSTSIVQDLRLAAERPAGLILVAGPAGAGKSTTLYALARHLLALQPGRSVMSLEDPVEQRIAGMAQIQISAHGDLDYSKAMRSLLRQDVEVLLVGEIRDAETAHVVVQAALTGHLIMSTLHSGDPAEAITRLLEMGIASYQLVSALSVCCSQRLLRRTCSACVNRNDSSCPSCNGTGYVGRIACGQLARMDERLREAVVTHSPLQQLRHIISDQSPDLLANAAHLVAAGQTTNEEVRRVLGYDSREENAHAIV